MTSRELAQRRHVLFTMLTALEWRYAPGPEPALIAALRTWLHGWPGMVKGAQTRVHAAAW